jgi:pimeloyl-ACP methyl ester carboxylesterase
MGSLIALHAAGSVPERVSRLVMVGTAYPMRVSRELLDSARNTPDQAIERVNGYSLSTWAAKPSYPGPGSWLHGGGRALMRRLQHAQTGVNLFEQDFAACDTYDGAMQAATAVRCPVHFVLGTRDQMTPPRASAELARALNARVHRLDAGHALMAETPDGVLAALRAALA